MKYIFSFITVLLVSISFLFASTNITNAWIFSNERADIPYCNASWECWLEEWIEAIKDIDALVNNKPASQFIQDVVKYVLRFLALIATLIIIYAWFNLLTWMWDEEKAKDTKKIIVYAIIWLVIIFLAGPIIDFVLNALYTPRK